MREERQQNALAALDILARADSVAFEKGRSDASERQVTEAEARALNAARTGAAWPTGEGEYKKWWTRAADTSRSDASKVNLTKEEAMGLINGTHVRRNGAVVPIQKPGGMDPELAEKVKREGYDSWRR